MNRKTLILVLAIAIKICCSLDSHIRFLQDESSENGIPELLDYLELYVKDIPKYPELISLIEATQELKVEIKKRITPKEKLEACPIDNPKNTKEIIDINKSVDKIINDFTNEIEEKIIKLQPYVIGYILIPFEILQGDINKIIIGIQTLVDQMKKDCEKKNISLEKKNGLLLLKGTKTALDQYKKNQAEIEKNNCSSITEENIPAVSQLKKSIKKAENDINEKLVELKGAYERAKNEVEDSQYSYKSQVDTLCQKLIDLRTKEKAAEAKKKADEEKKKAANAKSKNGKK